MNTTSAFLVCDATQQAIHISESADKYIRGSDCPIDIIGLFSYAHAGHTLRTEMVPHEEKRTALYDFEKWKVGNAFCLYEKATGEPVPAWWQQQLKDDLRMRA